MQFARKLLGLAPKRGRGDTSEEQPALGGLPTSAQPSSAVPSVGGLSAWSALSMESEGESSRKRQRSAKSFGDVALTTNPLFGARGVDSDASGSDASTGSGLGAGLGSSEEDEYEDEFSEFALSSSPTAGRTPDAFVAHLQHPIVRSALLRLEYRGRHPVGQEQFATIEYTTAAMLALCQRAGLQDWEITPAVLLTALWICESYHSQYRCDLSTCLQDYLYYSEAPQMLWDELRPRMGALQVQLLKRCSWRMPFDRATLEAALDALSLSDACDSVYAWVRNEALALHLEHFGVPHVQPAPPGAPRAARPPPPAAPGQEQGAGRRRRARRGGAEGLLGGGLDGRSWIPHDVRTS